MSVASCTLSRFAYDLYMWSTPEYGYVEVDDSVAGCSSIMPQKKNALTLECCKQADSYGSFLRVSFQFTEEYSVHSLQRLFNRSYAICMDRFAGI